MKTEQKQIEQMMLDVPQTIVAYDANPKGQQLYGEQREYIAEALYDAGYRKVLLDTENGKAVDVSQYAPWELIEGHTEREVEKARKETAREILDMLYDEGIDKEILECCRICDVNGVSLAKQICEKYGVEIEK